MRAPTKQSHKVAIFIAALGFVTLSTASAFADPGVRASIGVDIHPAPGVDIRLGAGNPGWHYGRREVRVIPEREVIVREHRFAEEPRWAHREEFYRDRDRGYGREERFGHERGNVRDERNDSRHDDHHEGGREGGGVREGRIR